MNEVFLIGKIITPIEFKFIMYSRDTSIAQFMLKTEDNQEITIKSYNEVADFAYHRLDIGITIMINGYLNSKTETIAKKITLISQISKMK